MRDGGCELVKCIIQGKVHGKRLRGRPRLHTVATSQNGWVEVWNKSFGTRGMALDGEDLCDMLHGRLIITPDGTTKEEDRMAEPTCLVRWGHSGSLSSVRSALSATGGRSRHHQRSPHHSPSSGLVHQSPPTTQISTNRLLRHK